MDDVSVSVAHYRPAVLEHQLPDHAAPVNTRKKPGFLPTTRFVLLNFRLDNTNVNFVHKL